MYKSVKMTGIYVQRFMKLGQTSAHWRSVGRGGGAALSAPACFLVESGCGTEAEHPHAGQTPSQALFPADQTPSPEADVGAGRATGSEALSRK